MRRSAFLLSLFALSLAACKVYDPLYCDEDMQCSDPERPFCDIEGEYPASEGVGRTCIPTPQDGGPGGTADGGGAADEPDADTASDATRSCSWTQFARAANVNSSGSDYAGSFSADGLSLYFDRTGALSGNGFNISTREAAGQGFRQPTPIEGLSGDDFDGADPEISTSGLEIFYRLVSAGSSIETATRASPTGTFGPSKPTGLDGFNPALSSDGLTLYFVGTGGSGSVQRATRTAIGAPWSAPVTLLPSEGYYAVDVSPDDLRLLLTTNPFLPTSTPVQVAERASTDDEFGMPVPVDREILVPDGVGYTNAKWDPTQTEMVATVQVDGESDIYYSACR